ncbi:MAG: hypothetical protein L0Z50_00825 [Verrucomicrobiales bacterium]|nr:hypothetical protein [Verrucomicrobiales bacterium]
MAHRASNRDSLTDSSVQHPATAAAERSRFIRDQLPVAGLFAGLDWRISPAPFFLDAGLAKELETLGRVLHQFNRAVNLLYRRSVEGKQPRWVAEWLDRGKPPALVELQRSLAFKNDWPRVIRPDLLLTDSGFSITELDSVPGGIGLTAWLNKTYSHEVQSSEQSNGGHQGAAPVIGGPDGMLRGFEGIFGDAQRVHIVLSDESATYRPEMEWLAGQWQNSKFKVQSSKFNEFQPGEAVYRFFELFDLANVDNAKLIFELAGDKRIRLTPPPKTIFEEKLLFALLWNRNLRGFWRQELGEAFFQRLLKLVPYTWLVDPAPLPPHGAIPELNITDWQQLKTFSHRERELILKVSGFSETAWGARGVYLGSDLPSADWSAAVDLAVQHFDRSPFVLQRYEKPKIVEAHWFDFASSELIRMEGRVRLCPYYFVHGAADAARAQLGGVLATICPADKKIIHGMKDAILAPCSVVA